MQIARNVHRPTARRYLDGIVEGFIELHGDRAFADDGAILAGIGWISGHPVTIIAQEKGVNLADRVARNFGCPQPEGYRKSLRLMREAEKFGRPILCLVDTQGAFCGTEAEERGQGNAIADNLVAMAGLARSGGERASGRGRKRRRLGAGRGQPRGHAGACGVLGALAGGLRLHPVEGSHPRARGRRGHADGRRLGAGNAASSMRSFRKGRARPTRIRRRPSLLCAITCVTPTRSWPTLLPTSWSRQRQERFAKF